MRRVLRLCGDHQAAVILLYNRFKRILRVTLLAISSHAGRECEYLRAIRSSQPHSSYNLWPNFGPFSNRNYIIRQYVLYRRLSPYGVWKRVNVFESLLGEIIYILLAKHPFSKFYENHFYLHVYSYFSSYILVNSEWS